MKRAALLGLVCFVLMLMALVVSPAWAFVSTGDGGWFWQNPLQRSNDLTAVSFPDASHGWAVGESGTILATSNSGATWVAQDSGTTTDLTGASFPDASHGWAVGQSGTILATSDGGATWVAQDSGTTESLTSVSFPDASHGWAVGSRWDCDTMAYVGVILFTTDGGTDWSDQSPGGSGWLNDVCFSDANHGWAVGGYPVRASDDDVDYYPCETIFATSDGGATWTAQNPGQYSMTVGELFGVCFSDASHGWAVGRYCDRDDVLEGGYTILYTRDGGAHWSQQNSPDDGRGNVYRCLCAVSAPDATHGWVVGSCWFGPDPSRFMSVIGSNPDGGPNWSKQSPGTIGRLLDVCFPDASHGWAVGENGTILATTTGGWPDATPPTTAISGVDDLWHNAPVTVTLSAGDPQPHPAGVAATYYTVDDGDQQTYAEPFQVSGDGVHEVAYWSVDKAGNREATQTAGVRIDATAPTTTISGADDLWHNTEVDLTLVATDDASASGVDATYSQIDDGLWTAGTTLPIPAPADHSNDGVHAIRYYSTDRAGNVEETKSVTVKIDTTSPVISVAYVGFRHHCALTRWHHFALHFDLTYRIDDNLSPTAAVTLEAVDFRGRVIKTVSVSQCPTGVPQTCRLPWRLSLLFCRWRLTASDLAGNTQSKLAGLRLFGRD
jgi:photosystem II stability/assembly factor-like uncharacterized protein